MTRAHVSASRTRWYVRLNTTVRELITLNTPHICVRAMRRRQLEQDLHPPHVGPRGDDDLGVLRAAEQRALYDQLHAVRLQPTDVQQERRPGLQLHGLGPAWRLLDHLVSRAGGARVV